MCWPGAPAIRAGATLAQFCALDHVIVSQDGGGFRGVTDEVLAARGLTRRVALSVPHFLFLLSALAGSDFRHGAGAAGARRAGAAGGGAAGGGAGLRDLDVVAGARAPRRGHRWLRT